MKDKKPTTIALKINLTTNLGVPTTGTVIKGVVVILSTVALSSLIKGVVYGGQRG